MVPLSLRREGGGGGEVVGLVGDVVDTFTVMLTAATYTKGDKRGGGDGRPAGGRGGVRMVTLGGTSFLGGMCGCRTGPGS